MALAALKPRRKVHRGVQLTYLASRPVQSPPFDVLIYGRVNVRTLGAADARSSRNRARFGRRALPVGIPVGPPCVPHRGGNRREAVARSEAPMVGAGLGRGGARRFLEGVRGRRREREAQPARTARARRPLPALHAASPGRALSTSRRVVDQWPQILSRRMQPHRARRCSSACVERDGLHVCPHRSLWSRCHSSVRPTRAPCQTRHHSPEAKDNQETPPVNLLGNPAQMLARRPRGSGEIALPATFLDSHAPVRQLLRGAYA